MLIFCYFSFYKQPFGIFVRIYNRSQSDFKGSKRTSKGLAARPLGLRPFKTKN